MDIWGRRSINMLGNIGMVIGWLLITFADNAAMLITGRIVEGFSRSSLATSITVRSHFTAQALRSYGTKNISAVSTSMTKP
jgi:MFS family permease